MKIEVPDKDIRKLLIDHIIAPDSLGAIIAGDERGRISRMIIDEVFSKYKNLIKWPEITKDEIKDRMLDILAERALDRIDE